MTTIVAVNPMGGAFLRTGAKFSLALAVSIFVGCGPEPAASPTPSPLPAAAPPPPPANSASTTAARNEASPPPPERHQPGWGKDAPLANFPQAPKRDHEAELAKAVAAGFKRIDSEHLTLVTDLPIDAEIERLPKAFDLAFPQWCAYFGVDAAKNADWKIIGYLVGDKDRFAQAGLLPADLPAFRHGYSRGQEFWLNEQPNPYYRRHLLLHEGTHSFMFTLLGSGGQNWYSEGMAELMATHHWDDQGLKLAYFPRSREDVPELGRIKLVQDSLVVGNAMHVAQVLRFGPEAHQQNDGYAWCWALAAFLDSHPRYQARFRQLPALVNSLEFNEEFLRLFKDDLKILFEDWQVFVANLEHAYAVDRMIVDFTPGQPLPADGVELKIPADQGWRNTGWKLEAGQRYQVEASGRYQLGTEPVIWWSEPGGVSIRYYHAEPLGKLLAVVRPDGAPADARSAFLKPLGIGLHGEIAPEVSGTLYLRINDSAGELTDNVGEADVKVKEMRPGT